MKKEKIWLSSKVSIVCTLFFVIFFLSLFSVNLFNFINKILGNSGDIIYLISIIISYCTGIFSIIRSIYFKNKINLILSSCSIVILSLLILSTLLMIGWALGAADWRG